MYFNENDYTSVSRIYFNKNMYNRLYTLVSRKYFYKNMFSKTKLWSCSRYALMTVMAVQSKP